jgi:hypothetical protein
MQMMDALEYERAYVEENSSKGLDIPLSTRLKVQEHLADQSSPSMIKQSTNKRISFFFEIIHFLDRSISAILRTSISPCSQRSSSLLTTAIDHTPNPRSKSSLPRFVRCSSPDSWIDESFRSIRSRFRFCS